MLRAAKHPYRPVAGVVTGFLATNNSDTGFLGCYRMTAWCDCSLDFPAHHWELLAANSRYVRLGEFPYPV